MAANKAAVEDLHARRAEGIGAIVEVARRNRDEAERVHASAVEAVQLCEAAVGAAEVTHAATGDDGARVLGAHDGLKLAHVRLEAAKKSFAESVEAHEGAVAALEHEKRAARLADLRKRAAPETVAAAVASPWAEIFDAYARLTAAAAKVRAGHLDSVAASSELRANGEYVQDLSPLHAVLPALVVAAERGQSADNLHALAPSFAPHGDPVEEIMAVLQKLDRLESHPAKNEWLRRQLANLATCRTTTDLDALEREAARGRQREVAQAYVAPAPRQVPHRRHNDEETR